MPLCLIVDDSKVVRTFARRIMEGFKFQTVEAENGEQALNLCKQQKPDLILLDWNMPVMDGLAFIKAFRKNPEHPEWDKVVVIFCTTENEIAKISTAIEAGANEYIMKPFDKSIIEDKLGQTGLL